MKTTTRIPAPIQAYTDDEGRPICGECGFKPTTGECKHQFPNTFGIPDPTCPVWEEGSKEVK